MSMRRFFHWLAVPAAALHVCHAQAAPFKGPFTGLFYGQGEGCWGALLIRTKTISWDSGDASCRRTPYTIIDEDLHAPFENYDHIVVRLHHLSKTCDTPYVGLYYYQPPGEAEENSQMPENDRLYYDWAVIGFASDKQYETLPYKSFIDGSINIHQTSLVYCELPYGNKPFPYGIPLD